MKVYLAGPLFTWYDRDFNRKLAVFLRREGIEVFLPQESEDNIGKYDSKEKLFRSDVAGIEWSDVVLANLDGADADSGTCWECGYGMGIRKTVICYRLDFRGLIPGSKVNLMMSEGADLYYEFPKDAVGWQFEEVAKTIWSLLGGLRGSFESKALESFKAAVGSEKSKKAMVEFYE